MPIPIKKKRKRRNLKLIAEQNQLPMVKQVLSAKVSSPVCTVTIEPPKEPESKKPPLTHNLLKPKKR